MTPAGTSNKLDVQNEWEENTHTIPTVGNGILNYFSMFSIYSVVYALIHQQDTSDGVSKYRAVKSGLIFKSSTVQD